MLYVIMKCPRCKKTMEKNNPWQECYECIRRKHKFWICYTLSWNVQGAKRPWKKI